MMVKRNSPITLNGKKSSRRFSSRNSRQSSLNCSFEELPKD